METSFWASIPGNGNPLPVAVGAATVNGLNGTPAHRSAVKREWPLAPESASENGHAGDEPIGVSEAFRRVLQQVAQVGPTDATVLITGETGTGKELIARRLHAVGVRRQRPLVVVNCAAL